MSQSSCKRDTKSKSHPGMKLAPVRVFSCKHPLSPLAVGDLGMRLIKFMTSQMSWLKVDEKHETNYCVSFVAVEIIGIIRTTIYSLTDIFD